MANYFLNILPFMLKRSKMDETQTKSVIHPAEDILDFHYPPQSRFSSDVSGELDQEFHQS